MSTKLDEKEKAIRVAIRAADRLDGRRLGPERDRFYAAIVDAHEAGASYREIAGRVEVSPQRVHQIVRDYGA